MHNILLNGSYKKIHFVGIGGISMSSLAEMLHAQSGYVITGSDWSESKATQRLSNKGIKVFIGHDRGNIGQDVELVVYTAAAKQDNIELIEAAERGIKTIDRASLLGQIMKNFKFPLSVTGSHGKTTTTSMLSQVFISSGCDPTISIGGNLPAIEGNLRLGDSDYFIVESDEYFNSFLKFFPKIAIILNIDMDHSDFFKNYENLWQSFQKFTKNIPNDGALVIYGGVDRISDLTEGLECRIVTYGCEDSDWCAEEVSLCINGCASFKVYHKGTYQGEVSLNVPGKHNVLNALAVFAASYEAGLTYEKIISGLTDFSGVDRRFQNKGQFNGADIIDDYAHHPSEIKATLAAAKNCTAQKIFAVFQPHTYSRTKFLFNDFVNSFSNADTVILTDIFAARENADNDVHSRDLAEKIRETGKDAHYFSSFADAEDFLAKNCRTGDMLITMGAGNIYLLGESLVNRKL